MAKVEYTLRNNKMYLIHSEVPYNLRRQGIDKVLAEKTFEKLTKEGYNAATICSYIKLATKRSENWNGIIE